MNETEIKVETEQWKCQYRKYLLHKSQAQNHGLARGGEGSWVVEHVPRYLKVEGSSPATAAAPAGKRATGGKRREKGFC